MKYIIGCALVLVLGFYGCSQQPQDCRRFKEGTFEILAGKTKWTIIRTGNWQMEFKEGDPDTTTYAVQWVDDCTYKLTPYNSYFKKYPSAPKNTVLTVSINKTTSNSYFQTTSSNTFDRKLSCEIIKVK